VRPDLRQLAEKCGMRTRAAERFYKLVIVGGGPAGLAAAVYGASEGIPLAVIERQATGGQAGTSALIENYLGFPSGVSGADLAHRATAQARRFGAEILTAAEATAVRVEGPYRCVTLADGSELACQALLLATGITVNRLQARGADAFHGAGIYYGAVRTEAENFRGQRVVIVGGANSAAQGALLLARHGTPVTMVVRGEAFRMSRYLVDQIASSELIEVKYHTEIIEACGSRSLEAVVVRDSRTGNTWRIDTPAVFVFIGTVPHSDLVAELVERDPEGFVVTGQQFSAGGRRPRGWKLARDPFFLETSIPGVFAAGDVRQDANRRVGSAVGDGGMAISFISQYLRTV